MQKTKRLLAVVLAMVMALAGLPMYGMEAKAAETLTEGDYQYEVNEDGNSVTITKYTGSSGDVTIPSEIDGKKVTSIGRIGRFLNYADGVFSECSGLEHVVIPEGITTIGDKTFWNCNNLVDVAIPVSVMSIGNLAFLGCSNLKEIELPSDVTSIGRSAFSGCRSIKNITIPSAVVNIGEQLNNYHDTVSSVFYGCISLEAIEVDASNENYCSEDGVLFDKSKETILKCPNKKNGTYTIPAGVKCIECDAFSGCSSLKTIVFSESVEKMNMVPGYVGIAGSVFSGCDSLSNIEVDENNAAYSSKDGILYDKTQKTIIVYPAGRKGAYAIPESVTGLGTSAFYGCKGLTNVTIPDSITDIAFGAFAGCGLTSVTVPGSVTRIELNAFNGCSNLASVVIPSSVTDIGGWAFDGCSDNLVIYGESGSEAEKFANENGFTFRVIGAAGDTSKITCKKTVYKVTYGAKPFKINAASGSKLTFTSSNAKIASVDKNSGKVTIKNTGVATITVKAGTKSVKVTVKVSPKKQTVKSAKAVKGRKLTVKWAKDKTASGYQVQISTAKNFKKDVKSKNVTKTSYTFTKLKTGKKYYVRVRSYKKSGKEMLYGDWSKAKQSGKLKK